MTGSGVYVGATPLDEACSRFLTAVDLRPLEAEEVLVEEAAGRVTAGVVTARLSSPHYHAAAMDGYALRAEATYGASERSPVRLELADVPGGLRAVRVDTGDPLPEGCDAVVPLEDALLVEDGLAGARADPGAGLADGRRAGAEAEAQAVELRAAVYPWHHVRLQGEDVVAGQVLFGENHLLTPADVGVLLAAGVRRVAVRRRPVVTFIPTGDEVVSPLRREELLPRPGQIVETNGTVARLTLESWGAEVRLAAPVPDDPDLLARALDEALRASDMVLIGAGSSAGRGDFTARVIAGRGRVLVHGVAVRPGKPVVLGVAEAEGVTGAAAGVAG
ncbi:MAG TPA: hypothetical protein DGR79_08275, partial [Clostridiales bacterium]|nr:hypothetical protein [Clostridiales bacterium]